MNINFVSEIEQAEIITHDGRFHSNDVFCTALLLMIFPDAKLCRVREVSSYNGNAIMYDIPGGTYSKTCDDGKMKRYNGVKYGSFGLLWKHFGHHFCYENYLVELVDAALVQVIDLCECIGSEAKIYTHIGELYDLYEAGNMTEQDAFTEAVELATNIISKKLLIK